MNPLSPWTFYRRHKRQSLLVLALVALMTLSVCTMVRLLDSVPENYEIAGNYLTRISLVSANGPTLDPGVVSRIRAHPGVEQVIQEKGLDISLPPIVSPHHLFGVSEADAHVLLDDARVGLDGGGEVTGLLGRLRAVQTFADRVQGAAPLRYELAHVAVGDDLAEGRELVVVRDRLDVGGEGVVVTPGILEPAGDEVARGLETTRGMQLLEPEFRELAVTRRSGRSRGLHAARACGARHDR